MIAQRIWTCVIGVGALIYTVAQWSMGHSRLGHAVAIIGLVIQFAGLGLWTSAAWRHRARPADRFQQ